MLNPPTPEPIDFATLELLPLGVIVVNDQGDILFYNQREEQISGFLRDQVVGRNFFLDVAPCTAVQAFHGWFQELMKRGTESVEFDFTFPFTLGPRQVRINLHPFHKGHESLCIIFVADITERERLRESIMQTQRFSELGEVAAKVAHNFNNLLAVVQVSSEIAMAAGSPEVRRQMERVLDAVRDGAALVGRFRGIAQSGLARAQDKVDVNRSVAKAVDYARQIAEAAAKEDGRRVGLRLNLAPGALMVVGDGPELGDALLNLLRNAIEAISAQGTVRVLTSCVDGVVVVDILDDGCGMTPEVQRRIFTPMFTTKGDRGTGLGLASARTSIRHQGGAIEVNSAPGRGSHFRITLPEAPPD
ncbi:MAG: ATP-binding protein [Holophaga sp.]|nr:ATP-binding protein [Holophaga sp.]